MPADPTRLAVLLLPLLTGCAAAPSCPPGLAEATIAEAFFGRNAGGREIVGDPEWARFMDDVVTPAFPDGLTVLDGAGQWRDGAARIARERSKLLIVILPAQDSARAAARLSLVIAAYRERFAQESVLLTTRAGCVAF